MGTKVQIENYSAGHYSMRDLSRESNGASWPSCVGDNNLPNGQLYYGFLPRTIADTHSGNDKDAVKQTMLEHEAIFRNQVHELHRLYRVQRNLMDEVRKKEQFERRIPYETSSSSSAVPSQIKYEDVQKWNGSLLPFANSVFGRASGLETVQSSPHSAKGKSIEGGFSPLQHCYSPKNSEVSESRPTKLRRRMFDLELPADEYADTDEVDQFGDTKVSDSTRPSAGKIGISENGKLSLNYTRKTDYGEDASRSDLQASKSKTLADLNEPLHVDETIAISSAEFLSNGGCQYDIKHRDLSTKTSSSSRDAAQNPMHGGLNGVSKNYHIENRPNSQDLFCYALESEKQKGNLKSISQGVHPVKFLLDPASQPLAFSTGDCIKGDTWKAKSVVNLEQSDRSYDVMNYGVPDPTMASHHQIQPSLFYPSDLANSWDPCTSTRGKQSSSFGRKSMSIQTGPLNSANLSKSPQSSGQGNGFLSNNWNLNCIPGAIRTFEGESNLKNGFDSGKNVFKATTSIDVKPIKDVNLNVALPSNNALHDHKSENPLAVLPWLRGKEASIASSSYEGNANANKNSDRSDCPSSRKILGVPLFENSPTLKKKNSALICPSAIDSRSAEETRRTSGRKLVFDINEPCELSDSDQDKTDLTEVRLVEKKVQAECTTSLRNHFDLNSCITEEEIPLPRVPDSSPSRKCDTGIDLEAPVVLEDDEIVLLEDFSRKKPGKPPELPMCREMGHGEAELAKSAAEAIIVISSSLSASLIRSEEEVIHVNLPPDVEDPLHWLADVACSSENHNKELDEFESMTLRLKECTSEEYFPKPSIPEFPNLEENNTRVLTTRTRKGAARRGRQRRDFQRDILPGLVSLSRHEVTEDMQTFGGLMRATGYDSWQFGPNRRNGARNGCGRGRRRGAGAAAAPAPAHTVSVLTQNIERESNNREMGMEDRRLRGWGKTTRRPRRQRLPAGNLTPPPLPFS